MMGLEVGAIRKSVTIIYFTLFVSLIIFIVAACSSNKKSNDEDQGLNNKGTEEKRSDIVTKGTYSKENEERTIHSGITNQAIGLAFEGIDLLIKNKTDETVIIVESSTEFFTKKNNEWQLYSTTSGMIILQSYIPSKTETKYDFSKTISDINAKEIKVAIYYQIGYEDLTTYIEEIVYTE